MKWAYYTVHLSDGRILTVRGVNEKDVAYVVHNPCQRNQGVPKADGEVIVEIVKED